jgi:hypothetical protein
LHLSSTRKIIEGVIINSRIFHYGIETNFCCIGRYGPQTVDAIKKFQKFYGIKPINGSTGPLTIAKIAAVGCGQVLGAATTTLPVAPTTPPQGSNNSGTNSNVSNGGGLNTTVNPPAPVISTSTPYNAPVGTSVLLEGQNFTTTNNALHFGSITLTNVGSPDNKTISFYVPGIDVGVYKVSVSNSNGTSNEIDFRIISGSAQPSITDLYPNGGEILLPSTQYQIHWGYFPGDLNGDGKINIDDFAIADSDTFYNGTHQLKIVLHTYDDTGETGVTTIADGVAAKPGTYLWTTGNNGRQNLKYKVSLEKASTSLGSSFNAISANFFRITPSPSITITAPASGESLLPDTHYSIHWGYVVGDINGDGRVNIDDYAIADSDVFYNDFHKVDVLLVSELNGVTSTTTLAQNVSAKPGTYSWLTENIPAGSQYRIALKSVPSDEQGDYTYWSGYFTFQVSPATP